MMLPKNFISYLDNYCCSAGGYHKHRAVCTDGLVVDVDAYDGVGSHSLSTLHHLLNGGVFGFGKYFLISASLYYSSTSEGL